MKLLALLTVASAILSVVGWQQLTPRPMLSVTVTITPTATTVSPSQTTVATQRQTEWINIAQVKPVGYYLSLLELNGTQPYAQLAKELRKLPDLTNATAVAKITYLALNATNPEVKEAFELMIKGGTPDSRDFRYSVPSWNTELQVLYWMACQNEFKKDDTLILAIAMVNAFWVSVGDEEVRSATYEDIDSLLSFFRETNDIQRAHGYNCLEDYALEAKVALVWTGNDVGTHGPYSLSGRQSQFLGGARRCVNERKLGLRGYSWNTASISTLIDMRKHADEMKWWDKDVDKVVSNLEEYFSFSGYDKHWRYVSSLDEKIEVDGEYVPARNMNNADFQYRYYLKNGFGIGVCEDRMALTDAFLKSLGVASLPLLTYWNEGTEYSGHTHIVYYEPSSTSWKAYYQELILDRNKSPVDFHIFKPPIRQPAYVSDTLDGIVSPPSSSAVPSSYTNGEVNVSMFHSFFNTMQQNKIDMFLNGVPTSQMKQWLLYS